MYLSQFLAIPQSGKVSCPITGHCLNNRIDGFAMSNAGRYLQYLSLAEVTSWRCWLERHHIKYYGDPSPTLAQARYTNAHKHHLLFLSFSLFFPGPQNHLQTWYHILKIITYFKYAL